MFDDLDIDELDYSYRLSYMDTDGNQVDVRDITVNQDLTKNYLVKLYPNITTNYANLTISTEKEDDLVVNLIAMSGQVIRKNVISERLTKGSTQYRIYVTDLEPGIYNLQVLIGDELTSKKLIVVGN